MHPALMDAETGAGPRNARWAGRRALRRYRGVTCLKARLVAHMLAVTSNPGGDALSHRQTNYAAASPMRATRGTGERAMGSQWTLESVPLASVDTALAAGREDLFYLVTAASFVESGAELYTANLVTFFDDDAEVTEWLRRRWQVEELGHGRVLREYVRHVWPSFDWDAAYAAFLADYSSVCTADELENSHSLELVARCVVETGTATFYRALAALAGEPVLAGIASRISAQEVDHYKHFYAYFRGYREREPTGRLGVAATLGRRARETRSSDADCALRHAFAVREGNGKGADAQRLHDLGRRLGRQLARHYPTAMASRMLLKPLALPSWLVRAARAPIAGAIVLTLH
jgi:hypothetical protein